MREADYQRRGGSRSCAEVSKRPKDLKRTPLSPTELKQRIDSELLQRGSPTECSATDAARIRLRAAEPS